MSRVVTEENKQIAKRAAAAFGGKVEVVEYWDEPERSMIPILTAENSPVLGFFSFSTVGLSDHPLPERTIEPPLGVEICGVAEDENYANALATAAFCVINNQWIAEPGRIFPGVVALNLPDVSVPHLMFVSPPYLWNGLDSFQLKQKTAAWVLAVPITDAELEYAQAAGVDALEDRLDEVQVDISDMNRSSTI